MPPLNLTQIRENRAAKVTAMRGLLATAESEKRSLNAAEQGTFDTLKSEIVTLEADETRANFMAEAERRMIGEPVGDIHGRKLESRVSILKVLQSAINGTPLTGAEAEYAAETERRTGRKAEGVFVPASLFEKRVNTTTTAAELVGDDHRADLYIAPFRDALLARRLGVRVLSGLRGNVTVPKYGTGLTVGWVAEGTAVPEGTMAFDNVTMTPKHVGGFTEMSRQLIQQSSPDIEALVRDDLAFLVAKSIDTALIKGGGSNEPTGVLATSGIQTANLATLTWANVAAMLEKLEVANASAVSWLTSPGVATKLRTTLKAAGIAGYLAEGGRVADLPLFVTNQVPLNLTPTPDTGIAILGDWSQVMLGIWSELDILVNPYAETPYKRGGVLVRAMATCDIAVRHPEAFVVASDVTL